MRLTLLCQFGLVLLLVFTGLLASSTKKLETTTLTNDKEKIAKITTDIKSLSELAESLEDTTLRAEFISILNKTFIKMERATQPPVPDDDEWKDFLRNKERCIAP